LPLTGVVQATLTKLYVHWGRARVADHPDAYARTVLVHEFIQERRSLWVKRVSLAGWVSDSPAAAVDHDVVLDLRAAVAALPPRQRATLVLRFYCDLNVDRCAEILGCSAGTVKSQTARAGMVSGSASNPLGWAVTVYARGQCHLTNSGQGLKCAGQTPLEGVTARFSESAPAVDGHSAFWTGTNLVWSYARGGWAWVNVPVPDFSALRHDPVTQGRAIKIARHLRFGAATPPLVFPAQLSGLTGQWQISDLHYQAGAEALHVDTYTLTTGTSRFYPPVGDQGIWTNAPYVDIHPSPRTGTCSPDDPSTQNTSQIINGYHAVVKLSSAGGHPKQEVCAAHADGLWVDIIEFGRHPLTSVTSLFRHLRLLGTHPADWTRNPLG
jgi:hypothetical protein